MSLNKTLDRLFAEIRREAKRNPDFANRLDAALRLHESRRNVPDAVLEDMVRVDEAGAKPKKPVTPASSRQVRQEAGGMAAVPKLSPLNPVGLLKREGKAALAARLASQDLEALRALVAEHNLDPSGETAGLDHGALAAHVLAQAQRRAERDEKLFDY
jgi:hypothetical protein